MSAISCIDSVIGKAADVMNASQAFQNPLAGGIASINNSVSNVQNAISGLSHIGTDFSDLISSLSRISPALSVQLEYSNFLSGMSATFPVGILSSPLLAGKLPGNATVLLGGLGFAALLGSLSGGLTSQDAMCKADAHDPCAPLSSVVAAVLSPAEAVLNAMQVGLDEMFAVMMAVQQGLMEISAMINQIAEFIASIEDLINQIVQQIVNSILGIINALLSMLNYELGKLLQAAFSNPCLQEFLGAVTTPGLQSALNVNVAVVLKP